MNLGSSRCAVLLAGSSLMLGACAGPSGEPGPFAGANGTAAASQITRQAGAYSGESMATGANVYNAAQTTVAIIAKHQATLRQQQVARQRAQVAVQKLRQKVAAQNQKAAATPAHSGPKVAALKPWRVPRYIAVETVKEPTTSPQAQKTVMIWDTQANDLVGNNVYDIGNPPPVGATSRFETYSAEYVGAGL